MMETDTVSETTTPVPAPVTAPAAPSAEENSALRNALSKVQQDYATLQSTLAGAIRERDTFREQVTKLEPRAKMADDLQVKVEGFINTGRESALVEALRAKLPSAEPIALRGVIAQLAEQGKATRYPEDPAAESAKVLKLIETEAPSLTRPVTTAGGSSLVRPAAEKPGYRGPFSK